MCKVQTYLTPDLTEALCNPFSYHKAMKQSTIRQNLSLSATGSIYAAGFSQKNNLACCLVDSLSCSYAVFALLQHKASSLQPLSTKLDPLDTIG